MKRYLLFFIAVILSLSANAQAPMAFNYQAVVRNNSGELLIDTKVQIKISILSYINSNGSDYTESHTATTNRFGVFTLKIGQGDNPSSAFSEIDWASTPKYLKVEIDINGSGDFELSGINQLLSVPYALYAKSSGDWKNLNGDLSYTKGNIGIGTLEPSSKLTIEGYETGTGRELLAINNISSERTSGAWMSIQAGNSGNKTALSHFSSSYTAVPGYQDYGSLASNGSGLILNALGDNGNIKFLTGSNYSERMRISSNGNLGIGTTEPTSKLTIVGNEEGEGRELLILNNNSSSSLSAAWLAVKAGVSGNKTALSHFSSNYIGVPDFKDYGSLASNGSGLILSALNNSGNIRFIIGSNYEERMRIANNGNIGIGTSEPKSKLEIMDGDIYINDIEKGVIMKSSNGNCWRVTVDNNGNLVSAAIDCP